MVAVTLGCGARIWCLSVPKRGTLVKECPAHKHQTIVSKVVSVRREANDNRR